MSPLWIFGFADRPRRRRLLPVLILALRATVAGDPASAQAPPMEKSIAPERTDKLPQSVQNNRDKNVLAQPLTADFVKRMHAALRDAKRPDRRLAAANLVNETITTNRVNRATTTGLRTPTRDEGPRPEQFLELIDDLTALTKDPASQTVQAAALALANLHGELDNQTQVLSGAIRVLTISNKDKDLSDDKPEGKTDPKLVEKEIAEMRDELKKLATGADKIVGTLSGLLDSTDIPTREAAAAGLGDVVTPPLPPGQQVRPGNTAEFIRVVELVIPAACRGLSATQPPEVRRLSAQAVLLIVNALVDLVNEGVATSTLRPEFGGSKPPQPSFDSSREDFLGNFDRVDRVVRTLQANLATLTRAGEDPDAATRLESRRVLEGIARVGVRTSRARPERIIAPKPVTEDKPADPKPKKPLEESFNDGADGGLPGFLVAPVVLIAPPAPVPPEKPKADPTPDNLAAGLAGRLKEILPGLTDPNVRGRLATMDILENLEDQAQPAVDQIVKALQDPNRYVRWSACRVLGKFGRDKVKPDLVVPGLAKVLRDPDLDLQIAAANALERYGAAASRAVDVLAETVDQGDPESRISKMRTLTAVGGENSGPAMTAIARNLLDQNKRVRVAAAETLGSFRKAAAGTEKELRAAVGDRDPEVRRAVSEAILRVTDE
jgi:HEAT repeat protein